MKTIRTESIHPDFIELVKHLDIDLAKRDGEDHAFYSQYNKIDKIRYTVILYDNEIPIGCGAMKEFQRQTMEIKRMFTSPESRGKGVATKILVELEQWAAELFYEKCILETGIRQPEAINLYKKSGYQLIPNYGQYAGIETSVCFEKKLK